jgi:hypothetical protein
MMLQLAASTVLLHYHHKSVLCCAVHADALRNEFLAAYGHQHLLTLTHLEKAGGRPTHTIPVISPVKVLWNCLAPWRHQHNRSRQPAPCPCTCSLQEIVSRPAYAWCVFAVAHLHMPAGLLKAHVPGSSRSSGFNYAALRKGLRLVVNEPDQLSDTPGDVSFLYKVCAGAADSCAALHLAIPALAPEGSLGLQPWGLCW